MGNFCNDTTRESDLIMTKEMESYNLIFDELIFMKLNPTIFEIYK